MKRLLTIFGILVLIAVIVTGIWARRGFHRAQMTYFGSGSCFHGEVRRQGFHVSYTRYAAGFPSGYEQPSEPGWVFRHHISPPPENYVAPQHQLWGLGIGVTQPDLYYGGPTRFITVPFWLAALLPATALATIAWHHRHTRHRRQLGLCANCGYDLRASRDRCPECGQPFTSTTAAEHPSVL